MEQETTTQAKPSSNVPKIGEFLQSCNKYFNDIVPEHIQQNRNLDDLFTDPTFPPNLNSLLSMKEDGTFIDQVNGAELAKNINADDIEWRRVSEVFKQFAIFEDLIEVSDIKQGGLTNCYFLSAVAALTEFPEMVLHKFVSKDPSKVGYYEIILFLDGKWQKVFVDDYFPFKKGTDEFAFSRTNGSEIWVILLEKAWAKVNGGYSNISTGSVSDPLQALTGFPVQTIDLSMLKRDDLWTQVVQADLSDKIMCTETRDEDTTEAKGLVKGHTYSLISAQQKKHNNDVIQLIKLLNPWGTKEWNGDWGDDSDKWDEETTKYYEKLTKADGMFFMAAQDYHMYFSYLHVARAMYNTHVKSYIIDERISKYAQVFKFSLAQESQVSLAVIFRSWRFHRNLQNINRPFSLVVAKVDDEGKVISVDGDFSSEKNIEFNKPLSPGNYFVWLCNPLPEPKDQPFEYIFRICCADLQVEYCGIDKDISFLKDLIISHRQVLTAQELGQEKGKPKKLNDFKIYPYKNLKNAGLDIMVGLNGRAKPITVRMSANFDPKYSFLFEEQGPNAVHNIASEDGIAVIACRVWDTLVPMKFVHTAKPGTTATPRPAREATLSKLVENLDTFEYLIPGAAELKISTKFNKLNAEGNYTFKNLEECSSKITKKIIKKLKQNEHLYQQISDSEFLLKAQPGDESDTRLYLSIKVAHDGRYLGLIDEFGKYCGIGGFTYQPDEDYYIGEWRDGRRHGQGKYYNAQGQQVYKGGYWKNMRNGKGLYRDGSTVYEGDFKADSYNGIGVQKTPMIVYKGQFENGVKHGVGVEYDIKTRSIYFIEYRHNSSLRTDPNVPVEYFEKFKNSLLDPTAYLDYVTERIKLIPIVSMQEKHYRKRENDKMLLLQERPNNRFLVEIYLELCQDYYDYPITITHGNEFDEIRTKKENPDFARHVKSLDLYVFNCPSKQLKYIFDGQKNIIFCQSTSLKYYFFKNGEHVITSEGSDITSPCEVIYNWPYKGSWKGQLNENGNLDGNGLFSYWGRDSVAPVSYSNNQVSDVQDEISRQEKIAELQKLFFDLPLTGTITETTEYCTRRFDKYLEHNKEIAGSNVQERNTWTYSNAQDLINTLITNIPFVDFVQIENTEITSPIDQEINLSLFNDHKLNIQLKFEDEIKEKAQSEEKQSQRIVKFNINGQIHDVFVFGTEESPEGNISAIATRAKTLDRTMGMKYCTTAPEFAKKNLYYFGDLDSQGRKTLAGSQHYEEDTVAWSGYYWDNNRRGPGAVDSQLVAFCSNDIPISISLINKAKGVVKIKEPEKYFPEELQALFPDKFEEYVGYFRNMMDLSIQDHSFNTSLYWGSKYVLNGFYIGQLNFARQAHGRGMIIYNNFDKGVFIGTWLSGMRHGNGVQIVDGQPIPDVYFLDRPADMFKKAENSLLQFSQDGFYDPQGIAELRQVSDIVKEAEKYF